jgi:hypothetical protein
MDSLPTGAAPSLFFFVLAAALSPVVLLFVADIVGRVRRRKPRVRPARGSSTGIAKRKGLSGGQ